MTDLVYPFTSSCHSAWILGMEQGHNTVVALETDHLIKLAV